MSIAANHLEDTAIKILAYVDFFQCLRAHHQPITFWVLNCAGEKIGWGVNTFLNQPQRISGIFETSKCGRINLKEKVE